MMMLRPVNETDHATVLCLVDRWWWGGRSPSSLLHRSMFRHFQNTSYVAEMNGSLVGILIGYISQTYPQEAYIHMVAVDPDYRGQQIGKRLYQQFFDSVYQHGCTTVCCICNPANSASIAFHRHLGFEIEEGDGHIDNLSVTIDYSGPGEHRICFRKRLPG